MASTWTFSDSFYTRGPSPAPVVGVVITLSVVQDTLFINESGVYRPTEPPDWVDTTDGAGAVSMAGIPCRDGASQDPDAALYQLVLDTGTVWQGQAPTTAGTYSLKQLKDSWNWGQVASGIVNGAGFAVQGPAGATGATGATGPAGPPGVGGFPGAANLSSYASLATAISSIGASTLTLVIDTPGIVSANLTIPANVTLVFSPGNLISVQASKTLTVQGDIIATPLTQLFDVDPAGSVVL